MRERDIRPPNGEGDPEVLREKQPLFQLGQVVATPAALQACARAEANPVEYFNRHLVGDWGDLEPEDKAANREALIIGTRILSTYVLETGDQIWIITEADRSITTMMLPEEY